MTEEQWLTHQGPGDMLLYLREQKRDRKLRLFACGCCRAIWTELTSIRSKRAVETAERYSDGFAQLDELRKSRTSAAAAFYTKGGKAPEAASYGAARETTNADAWSAAALASGWASQAGLGGTKIQARLLRDIFGNPFRPVKFDPTWQTPTVIAVAQTIYDERRFEDMPILADALEEAGCANDEILNHCRQDGVHVRGCWVIDLILGKE